MAIGDARFSPKTDNNPQAFKAKVDIRRRVLAAVGAANGAAAHVFDAFAGSGQMYSAVWKDAGGYLGCDLKWARDGRFMYAGDNRRVLRVVDLARFNVFDLDAYGSPWEQAIIIADRRKVAAGELFGLVLTNGDGRALTLRANLPLPYAVRELTGLSGRIAGVYRNHEVIENRILVGLAKRMSCAVAHRWQADGKTGAKVRYIGLVLKGMGRQ
jgi:hypothetical protein